MKSISKSAVVRIYRAYAPVYDLIFGRSLEAGRVELAKTVAKFAPTSLLEVGVGTGLALLHYPPGVQSDACQSINIDSAPRRERHQTWTAEYRNFNLTDSVVHFIN